MAHTDRPSTLRKRLFVALRYAGLALALAGIALLAQAWAGMGKSASGARLARM